MSTCGASAGFIQKGEPLNLELPNRKASIHTSSHFYLDDCPNAREPISDAQRLLRATRGSPSQDRPESSPDPASCRTATTEAWTQVRLLRNDGLNPPRPPTLGGRLRKSGIQAAETIIAAGAAGAAASQSFAERQTFNALRGGKDWIDRRLRIPRRPPGLRSPPDEVSPPIIGRPSEVEPLLERAGQRAAEVERAAARDEQFASQQLAEAEAAAGAAEAATAAEGGGGALALLVDSPTMHTQVSNPCRTSYNVTVARAFTKLLGAFVTFPDTDEQICSASAPILSIPAMAASSRRLESQMQLGALQYPRYPVASDAEHFHFLEIL